MQQYAERKMHGHFPFQVTIDRFPLALSDVKQCWSVFTNLVTIPTKCPNEWKHSMVFSSFNMRRYSIIKLLLHF